MPDGNGISVVSVEIDAEGRQITFGDEIPSFETLLADGLPSGCAGSDPEDLVELIEEIAVRKWDEFFEALGLDFSVGEDVAALFAQMLGCLERNLGVSRLRRGIRRRSGNTLSDVVSGSMTTEWETLLSRLDRRAQLLRHLNPAVAVPSAETEPSAELGIGILSGAGARDNERSHRPRKSTGTGNAGTATATTTTKSAREESQRSLNRVAYLGGVLLPFSVVSGILAIETPFGPGNPQFWIFWAVSVPLVLVTLGLIYADSIRKVEVWVEVAAATAAAINNNDNYKNSMRYAEQAELPTLDIEQAVPVSRIFRPISSSPGLGSEFALFDGLRARRVGDGDGDGDGEGEGIQGDQGTFIEKLWQTRAPHDVYSSPTPRWTRREGEKMWRKEELGWMGAFATMFRVYKLKKGRPA